MRRGSVWGEAGLTRNEEQLLAVTCAAGTGYTTLLARTVRRGIPSQPLTIPSFWKIIQAFEMLIPSFEKLIPSLGLTRYCFPSDRNVNSLTTRRNPFTTEHDSITRHTTILARIRQVEFRDSSTSTRECA